MIVETTRFGSLEYSPEQIISFVVGIPGFKQYDKFMIVGIEDSPFQYLQSLEDGELAFIIVSPFEFFPNYEFDLSEQVKEELEIKDGESLEIYNIVRVPEELSSATINLLAPIIMNTTKQMAVQYILPNSPYSIQHQLFSDDLKTGGE
ncbi:flagellar assembly protein FliW [Paenibacillus sp. FSL H8-0537]|uniref:flagellar assembly protein FliW n=1 Tax=Paenibacillus sp. FSL H8-0537 TaxID=2921399 RepID=UPI003101AD6E